MTQKKVQSSFCLVCLFVILSLLPLILSSCATRPEASSSGGLENPGEHDFAVIVLDDLRGADETAAYISGVSTGLNTQKITPEIPVDLAREIRRNPRNLDWLSPVTNFLGQQFDFTKLVVIIPGHSTQEQTVLRVYGQRYDVIRSNGYLVDVETSRLIGSNRHFYPYTGEAGQTAGLASISRAATAAAQDLVNP